jgi:hypothetical protein
MKRMNYIAKLIAISCLGLLTITCIILHNTPASGYEVSIYGPTQITWILLIIATFGGFFIIVDQVLRQGYKNSHFWLTGLLILVFCRIIIILTPFIRGYYTWNGDNITHIGYIKDIISTGFITNNNPYPITHIFLSIMVIYTNLQIEFIANNSTAFISVLCIIFIYLASKKILPSEGSQILVAAISGSVLISGYDVYLMPNGWSVLLLPLVFYTIFNSSKSFKALSIILLILYPFFHPLSALILILSLIAMGIANYTNDVLYYKKLLYKNILMYFNINYIFVASIVFLFWILTLSIFNDNIGAFLNIFSTGNTDPLTQINSQLNKIHISSTEFFNLLIHMYGHYLIFGLLFFITVIIIYKLNKYGIIYRNINNIICIIFLYILLYLAYFLNVIPGLAFIGSDRILKYIFILTPLPLGFTFNYILTKKYYKITIVFVILLLISSIISIYSSFISPYVMQPSIQVTNYDMSGAKWFIENKDINIPTSPILNLPSRLADDILGYSSASKRADLSPYYIIPNHFNYTNYTTLGKSIGGDTYIPISQLDEITYQTVWNSTGRFDSSDFQHLEYDTSLNRLYDNGEYEVFLLDKR